MVQKTKKILFAKNEKTFFSLFLLSKTDIRVFDKIEKYLSFGDLIHIRMGDIQKVSNANLLLVV